jgi:hypothetical protein
LIRYKLRIACPGGRIETVINDPGVPRRGLALIAHPHPLHGGSMDNKVVLTMAKTLLELGYVAVRPNFRGVGMSEGDHDHGQGEVEDMLAIAEFVSGRYPALPLILAGFSFGAYVQAQVCRVLDSSKVVLVGPAINMFDFGAAPAHAHVIHGERDELVPLSPVRDWADAQGIGVTVVPGADHFFHGKLTQLKQVVTELCRN